METWRLHLIRPSTAILKQLARSLGGSGCSVIISILNKCLLNNFLGLESTLWLFPDFGFNNQPERNINDIWRGRKRMKRMKRKVKIKGKVEVKG
jgi:hypothetical protein